MKPDGGNNIEETPTDTRVALESWQTYLHMYDEEGKKNKVVRDQFMVDERLLKHEDPHACGISTDRESFRIGPNRADVQDGVPLTEEQEEMQNFELQQYWREDDEGWIVLRIPLPGNFFTTDAFLHGLANFKVNIQLNSDSFCLVSRATSPDGSGAVNNRARYIIDGADTCPVVESQF